MVKPWKGAAVCALALILISGLNAEKPAPVLDVPASGQAAGSFPPVWEPLLAESASLPPSVPETTVSDAPVFTTTDYRADGPVYYKNQTAYDIHIGALLERESPVTLGDAGVQVLIMHTHGSEAYTPTAAEGYTATGDHRTTDSDHNMLRIGKEVCDRLNARGISTIHSTTLNDYPAYNGSYNRALKDIQRYVEQHPTIRLVIDLHRDAIASGGVYYKTSASLGGESTAQLMFVTGTDGGGLSHPDWRDNLAFQARLHQRLNGVFPGIMRPMSIRESRYNQHVRAGSMLVEVGSCGNTLEEALAAAGIFAETLADLLLEQ